MSGVQDEVKWILPRTGGARMGAGVKGSGRQISERVVGGRCNGRLRHAVLVRSS